MGWKNPQDPRDPWAWRNTWTDEARTDYAELWIVIPLILLLVLLAFLAVVPIFIHAYCRSACPCPSFWSVFDNFLQVLHDYGKKDSTQQSSSFENPAFDPEIGGGSQNQSSNSATNTKQQQGSRKPNQINDNPRLSHLRHSVRESKTNSNKKGGNSSTSAAATSVARSKSCPSRPANVPRIKI